MSKLTEADIKPPPTIHYGLGQAGTSSELGEEHIFSLLFGECDREGTGLVDVEELIGYIRRMQLQVQHPEGEESLDSQHSSDVEDYDLKLLHNMLDCNCDENNKINQETYTNIIRKWVNTIRARARPSSPQIHTTSCLDQFSPMTEESSQSSHSLSQDEPNFSYGSYDLDKNHSHDSLDVGREQELSDLVSKYQHEMKRLNDQNKDLLRQHESSEETLKDYQSRNKMLHQKLEEAQGSIVKLKQIKTHNVELGRKMDDTSKENQDLAKAKERLNKELVKMKSDLREMKDNLSDAESERAIAQDEFKTIQQMLVETKEVERNTMVDYESRLTESRSQLELMNHDLNNERCTNVELQSTVSELEAQLRQIRIERGQLFSSTPHHPQHALSLHEEILGQEKLLGDSSPVSPLLSRMKSEPAPHPQVLEEVTRSVHTETHVNPAMESFTRLMEETDNKIQLKHSLIVRDLGDLVFEQSPISHYDNTSMSQDDSQLNKVESKLKTLLRKKNQFKNENLNLRKENEDLIEQIRMLEEKLTQHQITPPTYRPRSRTDRGTSPLPEAYHHPMSIYSGYDSPGLSTADPDSKSPSLHRMPRHRTAFPLGQNEDMPAMSEGSNGGDDYPPLNLSHSTSMPPVKMRSGHLSPTPARLNFSSPPAGRQSPLSPKMSRSPSPKVSRSPSPITSAFNSSFLVHPPSNSDQRPLTAHTSVATSVGGRRISPSRDPPLTAHTSSRISPSGDPPLTAHTSSRISPSGDPPLTAHTSVSTSVGGHRISPSRDPPLTSVANGGGRRISLSEDPPYTSLATTFANGESPQFPPSSPRRSSLTPPRPRRSSLSPSPPRSRSPLSHRGIRFADEPILNNSILLRDEVEDPSLDADFKAGDYSPKHSSSVGDETQIQGSKSVPIPAPRCLPGSQADDELLEDIRIALTPTATPDFPLSTSQQDLPEIPSVPSLILPPDETTPPSSPPSSRRDSYKDDSPDHRLLTGEGHSLLAYSTHTHDVREERVLLVKSPPGEFPGLSEPGGTPPKAKSRLKDSLELYPHEVGLLKGEEDSKLPPRPTLDRAMQTVAIQPSHSTNCLFSAYQTMRIAVVTMFFAVLILAFIVLLVLSRDAVGNCGSYCPHSPIHLLYSSLEPYLHRVSDTPPPI